jgi:hypothetical protein
MKYFPLYVAIKSTFLIITRKIFFDKNSIGHSMIVGDKKYEIFRYAYRKKSQPPKATFIVWFSTKLKPPHTKLLSIFTIIGFLGFPGWISKKWLISSDGDFCGIYQFDSFENAVRYQNSYAMQFSKWRSIKGYFKTEVSII